MSEDKVEYRKVQGMVGETSFTVVLPKQYATHLGIGKGDVVKVKLEGDSIVIKKVE